MNFDGAVIKEQGITFAIAVVKEHVLRNPTERDSMLARMSLLFGVPTVLMAQDSRGTPQYWERRDIVDFLANVPPQNIPWLTYTLT